MDDLQKLAKSLGDITLGLKLKLEKADVTESKPDQIPGPLAKNFLELQYLLEIDGEKSWRVSLCVSGETALEAGKDAIERQLKAMVFQDIALGLMPPEDTEP